MNNKSLYFHTQSKRLSLHIKNTTIIDCYYYLHQFMLMISQPSSLRKAMFKLSTIADLLKLIKCFSVICKKLFNVL